MYSKCHTIIITIDDYDLRQRSNLSLNLYFLRLIETFTCCFSIISLSFQYTFDQVYREHNDIVVFVYLISAVLFGYYIIHLMLCICLLSLATQGSNIPSRFFEVIYRVGCCSISEELEGTKHHSMATFLVCVLTNNLKHARK